MSPLDDEVVDYLLAAFRAQEDGLPADVPRSPEARASIEALVLAAAGHRDRATDALMQVLAPDDNDLERSLYAAAGAWASAARLLMPGRRDGDLLIVETDSGDDEATAVASFMSAAGCDDRDAALAIWKQLRHDPKAVTEMAVGCLYLAAGLLRHQIDQVIAMGAPE